MNFSDYLLSELPALTYFDLPELLGPEYTKSKVTRLIRNPARMNKDEIKKFSEILDLIPEELIKRFGCGYSRITLEEKDQLTELKSIQI